MSCSWMKDAIAPVLALVTVVGGFSIIYMKPDLKTEILELMMLVLAFYFGSSSSSRAKDETIKELGGGKTQPPPGPVG